MNSYNDPCDNKIYSITSKIIYLFIVNLCFLFTIAPVIIYFFGSGRNLSLYILTFIGVLVGPALATMFSTIGRFMKGENTNAIKDYFYFYKVNLLQGLVVAVIFNAILMISYIDLAYFLSINNKLLVGIFIIIIAIVIATAIYVYPILARINAKTIDIFKLAIKLALKRIYITLTIISLLIISLGIVKFTGTSLIALLFGTSALCYGILYLERNTLREAEEYLKAKYIGKLH